MSENGAVTECLPSAMKPGECWTHEAPWGTCAESIRNRVIDLVALMYFRASNESDVYDEVWDLGCLAGWTNEEESMDLDDMRAWLKEHL